MGEAGVEHVERVGWAATRDGLVVKGPWLLTSTDWRPAAQTNFSQASGSTS